MSHQKGAGLIIVQVSHHREIRLLALPVGRDALQVVRHPLLGCLLVWVIAVTARRPAATYPWAGSLALSWGWNDWRVSHG